MSLSRKRKIMLAGYVGVIVVGVSVAVYALTGYFNPGSGEVPMTQAPVASSSPTSPPTPRPTPSATPSIAPSEEPIEQEPAALQDIDGIPVHIEIRQGNGVLVNADIVPISLESDGKLVPPSGLAGVYYSQQDWNTIPGNLDTYRGIVAGHNIFGSGAPDVFFNLGQVKEGDVIILTYKLNATGEYVTAEFTAAANAVSAPKADVVNSDVEAYRHIWQPAAEAGRYLTVLSCDLATANPGEYALNNWVVDAVRTK